MYIMKRIIKEPRFNGKGGISRVVSSLKNNNRYDLIKFIFSDFIAPNRKKVLSTPTTFIYSFKPKNGIILDNNDIIENKPIINDFSSFTITAFNIVTDTNTQIITVTMDYAYKNDYTYIYDGLSFKNRYNWYNTNTTDLTIISFGNIPLASNGDQFGSLNDLTFTASDKPATLENTSFHSCFAKCSNFNSPIYDWDTSVVFNMSSMFNMASLFNQDISGWDTSNVIDMSLMFRECEMFNQNISGWNTSNVTNMTLMFNKAINFNNGDKGDTSNYPLLWNVSKVKKFSFMFEDAYNFNQPLQFILYSSVNYVQKVKLDGMFQNAYAFNQNISYDPINNYWNTSNVSTMIYMFYNATKFNNGYSPDDTEHPLGWYLPISFFRIHNFAFRNGSSLTSGNGLSRDITTGLITTIPIGNDYP